MKIFAVVGLLLLAATSTLCERANYVAIIPSVIRPAITREISVTIMDHVTSDVTVMATMDVMANEETVTLSAVEICQPGTQKTLELEIPVDLDRGEYNLNLVGTGGVEFNETTTVKADLKFLTLLVQTDKATYKPGDLVRFRALAVYSDLTPYKEYMEVLIMDGNENKIKQFPRQSSEENPTSPNMENGVFEGQLQLSDQPVEGTWKLKVTAGGQTETKEIEVEEYVLPKYEVALKVPDFLHDGMDALPIIAEAKYTYGQPVDGIVCVSIEYQQRYYRSNEYRSRQYCKDLEEGRANFTIPYMTEPGSVETSLLDIMCTDPNGCPWYDRNSLRYSSFKIDAEVRETLTGNVLVDNKTVDYEVNKVQIEFLDSTPDTFKSGLPYTAYLQVKQANGAAPEESDLTFANGTRVPIVVTVDYSYRGYTDEGDLKTLDKSKVMTYDVGPGGITPLVVEVPERFSTIDLRVTFTNPPATQYYGVQAYKRLNEFKNRDNEAIQIGFSLTSPVQSGQRINFDVTASTPIDKYRWEIYSKGAIVHQGVEELGMMTNESSFMVEFDAQLAQMASPGARILVYYFTANGEIVADSIEFQVDALFANQVTLSFAETDPVLPGANVSLTVSARPESYIGLLAVDKSVTLLRTGNDLSQEEVKEDIAKYDSNSDSWDDDYYGGPVFAERGRRKRRSMCFRCYYPVYSGGNDASELFENAGLIVLTDGYKHTEPDDRHGPPSYWYGGGDYMEFAAAPGPQGEAGRAGPAAAPQPAAPQDESDYMAEADSEDADTSASLAEPTQTRTEFAETWLWTDMLSGEDGTVTMQYTVPDTITSWTTSAFALHSEYGLGIAENNAEVTVFQNFFASLNLPYSVVRGERFRLQVVVFNYMSEAQTVHVTLKGSSYFMVLSRDEEDTSTSTDMDETQIIEVPPAAGESAFFWIEPTGLGSMDIEVLAQSAVAADALRRTLIVEPEGMEESFIQAWFVDLSTPDPNGLTHTFTVGFPEDTVMGSQKIRVSANADLMGTTIDNLDGLLRMPSGCGEQNMLNFAPNIYVMDYLTATGQDDASEMSEKAIKYMETGYQRELKYKHEDGSYSAFGTSDNSGSTWLTAFVIRCFNQARGYIELAQSNINQALTFLIEQQERDGTFGEPGRVIHTDMQGGGARGVGMSAYVLITLLENRMGPINDQDLERDLDDAIEKSVTLLSNELQMMFEGEKRYALSVTTYALHLAAEMPGASAEVAEDAQRALDYLEQLTAVSGSVRYWTENGEPYDTAEETGCSCYCPRPKSNAIEMTAYALLTYAVRREVAGGLPIMKWLVTQRNQFGGYGSTQDTVIGIMALSEFATMFSGADSSLSLDITLRGMDIDDNQVFLTDFTTIDAGNARLYQFRDVRTDINRIEMTATGEGVALVQMAATYNVLEEPETGIEQECVASMDERTGTVTVRCCASWMDLNTVSGMVVSEWQVLSGYSVNTDNIMQLNPDIGLRRYEMLNGKLVYYFDELTNETMCFEAQQTSVTPVENLKPAVVKTYQYYETDVSNSISYLPDALVSVHVPTVPVEPTEVDPSGAAQATISLLTLALLTILQIYL